MEEKQTFSIGDRVEHMCVTCGVERGHIVASISKSGKVNRVSCPICGSRVPYKKGVTRHASTNVGAPYDRARTYRRGDTLVHPSFGEGEVTVIIEPGKIDVLFADRMRRLIHADVSRRYQVNGDGR
jgi:DNA-directed RNA polymerase subunit RPC12/RpoP